ncbi:MAG: S-methyl-5'-thioadenosine phosphorylase, partial [Myxococcota bacterium]|nr:S-methyl-5'-thioadenosine phosphorylase [Myxococcota bacterium]
MTDLHPTPLLAIIGGSGLYGVPGMQDLEWRAMESPWGQPSDSLLFGRIHDTRVVFLPRHGRGHRLSPSDINYRANIDILKRSGVTDILSLSAVGSFREECAPGEFVICDQFIDRTFARDTSFFGSGLVAHVS